MRISYITLAKGILIAAFLEDPIGALVPSIPFALMLDGIVFITVGYVLTKARVPREMRWSLLLIALAGLGLFINVRHSPALLSVLSSRAFFMFLLNVWFFMFAFSRVQGQRFPELMNFLILILKLNIAVILTEALLINFIAPGLYALLGTNLAEYRIQPNPVLIDAVPNGLVLGIQNASILSVAGVFTWFPWNRWKGQSRSNIVWLSLSILAWILTVTGTSVFVFAFVLLLIAVSGTARGYTPVLVLGAGGVIAYLIRSIDALIRARYSNPALDDIDSFVNRNIAIYLQPLESVNANFGEALIGSGHFTEAIIAGSPLLRGVDHADFGLLIVAVRFGIVLVPLIFVFFLGALWHISTRIRTQIPGRIEREMMISGLAVVLALFVSTIPYMTLSQSGPAQYFAAVFALLYWWTLRESTRASD